MRVEVPITLEYKDTLAKLQRIINGYGCRQYRLRLILSRYFTAVNLRNPNCETTVVDGWWTGGPLLDDILSESIGVSDPALVTTTDTTLTGGSISIDGAGVVTGDDSPVSYPPGGLVVDGGSIVIKDGTTSADLDKGDFGFFVGLGDVSGTGSGTGGEFTTGG